MEKLFEAMEPGCAGVIANYRTITREKIKAGFKYMNTLGDPQEDLYEGHDYYDPPEEYYSPSEEFGGTGHDEKDDTHSVTEGGGDFDNHKKDEL